MRLLLDESVPRDLREHLAEHEVSTVRDEGWQVKSNGELLALTAPHFAILITPDQNLPHQQNLARFELGVIVLVARRNRLADYLPLIDRLREELARARPGEAVLVSL